MATLTNDKAALLQERNEAYAGAVPGIQGLYPSFHTAVTILRIARSLGELDESDETDKAILDTFYDRLKIVELNLFQKSLEKPFVVLVEGLDGTGKTTLVDSLAQRFGGMSCSTPTASMASVRDIFDKRGGAVSRAFYMVSNYVLQHEIMREGPAVAVIDRWYSSTCAYSIGYKNTEGGPEAIDRLDESLFQWPQDLVTPDLLFVLQVDDDVRRQRVAGRGKLDNHNPWDDRLSNDPSLGQRIVRALERVTGPKERVMLNANQAKEAVILDAERIMSDRMEKHMRPWVYFKHAPLQFFRWNSACLGLCDPHTGRRCKHAPWAFQIALNAGVTPSLRSVGIHSVDEAGFLFFTWGHPGGGRGGDGQYASAVWVGGEYPHEQQWRAEGFLCSSTYIECEFMNTLPPESLVAQITASEQESSHATNSFARPHQPETHADLVVDIRKESSMANRLLVAPTRFVPLRMEVLIGGPSSPGGPKRYEWFRGEGSQVWKEARCILPFSPPMHVTCPTWSVMPLTVAIMGTHCSGKTTLGKRLASMLNWPFHSELGDILRQRDSLVESGHLYGNGSSSEDDDGSTLSWDEKLYLAECKRDEGHSGSRVVETWHVGNLAWAAMRLRVSNNENVKDERVLFEKARHAINIELSKAVVLLIQLKASPEVSIRRRQVPTNAARLPMKNEIVECEGLHEAIEVKGGSFLDELHACLNVPILKLENTVDGEFAIEEVLRSIVQFVNANHWRRASHPSLQPNA